MKKNLRKAVTVFFIVACLLITLFARNKTPFKQSQKKHILPIPTQIINEQEEGNKQKTFEQWYEQMHRAAPGVNWRAIDQNTRYQKYLAQLHSNNSERSASSLDTLADGNIIGEWKERGSNNEAGRIWSADIDTSTGYIYCGSAGENIWRGTITGQDWTVLNDKLPFNVNTMLRIIPTGNGRRIIGGGDDYVYYSDDNGNSWIPSNGLDTLALWGSGIKQAIVADDSLHTIYLVADQWDWVNWYEEVALYKSTDKGTSFTCFKKYPNPTNGTNYFDIWAPRYGSYNPTFINDDSIFSIDLVSNKFSFVSTINLNSTGFTLLTGCETANNFYLYAYVGTNLYQSSNGGSTWNFIQDLGWGAFGSNPNAFSCSVTNPQIIYFGDIEGNFSTNGGVTWSKTNAWTDYYGSPSNKLHCDIPCIIPLFNKAGQEFEFIGTDGGLYISYNNLDSVQNLSLNGLNVSQYYSVYTNKSDTNIIYAGAQDQGFQRCQNASGGTLGFTQLISGDYGQIVSTDSGKSIWNCYPTFVAYYADAATDAGPTATWNFNSTTSFWMPPMMADPKMNNVAYFAGGTVNDTGSYIIRLSETEGTIGSVQLPFDFYKASDSGFISALAISPINNNYWYVLTDNGNFFWSNNSGTTWNKNSNLSGLGANYLYGATIYPSHTDSGVVYIGGSGYSNSAAFVSYNYGQTFTAISNGLPLTTIFQLKGNQNDSLIFAATEVGPYVFVVSEQKWYDIQGNEATDQTYWTVDYINSSKTARFGTYGRGIWDLGPANNTATEITDLNINTSIDLYPNPSSTTCLMNIVSQQQSKAIVTIYSESGQPVSIKSVVLNAGNNPIPLDIHSLSQGLYLVQLNTGAQTIAKKLVKLY